MPVAVVTWLRRRPEWVFGGAAMILLPWIVILGLTQQDRGIADNIEPVRLTFVGVVVVGSVVVLATAAKAVVPAVPVGGAVAGFALAAVWFDLVTRVGLPVARLVTRLGAYTGIVGVVCAVIAVRCLYWRPSRNTALRVVLGVALVVLVLEATSVVTSQRPTLPVDHLTVAWVGLDIGELIGLTSVAVALRKRSRLVVLVGPATAALLFSDAVINVLTAGGVLSVLAALAMAVIEVGLGCLAVAVALRWAHDQPREPVPVG